VKAKDKKHEKSRNTNRTGRIIIQSSQSLTSRSLFSKGLIWLARQQSNEKDGGIGGRRRTPFPAMCQPRVMVERATVLDT
jgi:hypothetical protein